MKKYEMPEILEELISVEDAILASGNLAPSGWQEPDRSIGLGGIN